MAAELEQRFAATVTLIEGSRGVFDVRRDGELIFSKKTEGRYPDLADLAPLLEGASEGEIAGEGDGEGGGERC